MAAVRPEADLEQGLAATGLLHAISPPSLLSSYSKRGRSGTFRSVSSGISRVSHIPLSIIKTFTQRNVSPQGCSFSDVDRAAQDDFFRTLLGADTAQFPVTEAERLSAPCVLWYAKFLEGRFRSSWTTLLRPALAGLHDMFNEPQPDEIAVVYHFLSVVARMLLTTKNLEMVKIVDKIDIELHLFKQQPNGERIIPNQLVFVAVGWLTMLYDPSPTQAEGQLQLRRSTGLVTRPRRFLHASRTFTSYQQQDFDMFDHPIITLLRKFGQLIPEAGSEPVEEPERIVVSYVCFSTLDKIAEVKIEWVNSLAQHLEFDHVRRILKVFRFPSFCLLMFREVTLISRLYLDHCEYKKYVNEPRMSNDIDDLTPEYFREILLSYRLIFGQNKASYRAFRRKVPTWGSRWNCSMGQGGSTDTDRNPRDDDSDPLLITLCGSKYNSPNAHTIYEALEALDDVTQYYHPHYDFPFLGRRLLSLQAFVKGRNPHTWKALWHDRRNIAYWWTFWAVLFIGGVTILLGSVQAAFQIWGSVSSQKQLDASQPSSSPSCSSSS